MDQPLCSPKRWSVAVGSAPASVEARGPRGMVGRSKPSRAKSGRRPARTHAPCERMKMMGALALVCGRTSSRVQGTCSVNPGPSRAATYLEVRGGQAAGSLRKRRCTRHASFRGGAVGPGRHSNCEGRRAHCVQADASFSSRSALTSSRRPNEVAGRAASQTPGRACSWGSSESCLRRGSGVARVNHKSAAGPSRNLVGRAGRTDASLSPSAPHKTTHHTRQAAESGPDAKLAAMPLRAADAPSA